MDKSRLVEFLKNIGASEFQRLGDKLLSMYKPKYENLVEKGNHLYENKTVKGTPDSYKYIGENIIAVQYTVAKYNLEAKMIDDLEKVIEWELFINAKCREVVLVCNSRQNDQIEKVCRSIAEEKNFSLDILWLDNVINIIESKYDAKVIIKNLFGIDLLNISTTQDFKKYYNGTYLKNKQQILSIGRNTILDEYKLYISVFNESNKKKTYRSLAKIKKGILLGNGGVGKSYIMKRVFLHSFQKNSEYSVFVELDNYIEEDLIQLLKKNLECEEVRISSELIEQYLREKKFFIILDGFDEISKVKRNKFIKKCLNDHRYKDNKFLLSSRKHTEGLERLNDYERFYANNISKKLVYKKVINKIYDKYRIKKIKSYLDKKEMNNLLKNTLNLSILVKLIKENNISLENISDKFKNENMLYGEYVDNIIRWELRKLENTFIEDDIKNCMAFIAYYMTKNCIFRIDNNVFKNILKYWIRNMGLEEEYNILELKKIINNNLIFRIEQDKYRFDHKNFRLYFLQEYITKYIDDEELKNIITNPLFKEAFIWISKNDTAFVKKHINVLPEKILKNVLSEIPDDKADDFLTEIRLCFNKKVDIEIKDKAYIVFERFKYSESVLDIAFDYLKNVEFEDIEFEDVDLDEIFENDNLIKCIYKIYYKSYINIFWEHDINYNRFNLKWIEEGKKSKLIKIISYYVFKKSLSDFHLNDTIFNIYTDALLSNDEQLIYNALKNVEENLWKKLDIPIFNICATGVNSEKIYPYVKKVDKNISERVKEIIDKINLKMNPKEYEAKSIDIGRRIENYKENNDYRIGTDFAEAEESTFFKDQLIDILGKNKISDILLYSLEHDIHNNSILNLLDCIYFYYISDLNILACISNKLCNNDCIEVQEQCLKVLCGRIDENKLNNIKKLYNNVDNKKQKMLVIFGIWVMLSAYENKMKIEYKEYYNCLKRYIEEFKCLMKFNIIHFIEISNMLWYFDIYIKDYEINEWFYRYKTFFYDMILQIDDNEIMSAMLKLLENNINYKDMVLDTVKVYKNEEWISILLDKKYITLDDINTILSQWNDI